MLMPWLPGFVQEVSAQQDAENRKAWEERQIAPEPCLDLVTTIIGQLRRLGFSREDPEELFKIIRKNLSFLLSRVVPGDGMPANTQKMIHDAVTVQKATEDELGGMRDDLLAALMSIREFLEALLEKTEVLSDEVDRKPVSGRPAGYVPMKEKKNVKEVRTREMGPQHLSDVVHIEQQSFPTSPWDKENFQKFLRVRNCHGIVAMHEESVVGYLLYRYDADQKRIHVIVMAVNSLCRRQRVGEQLMNAAKEEMYLWRASFVTTKVRETNKPAQYFYASQDFLVMDTARAAFDDTKEDGIDMVFTNRDYVGVAPENNRIKKFFEAIDAKKKRKEDRKNDDYQAGTA
jgi:ribosomal protein S18 acetylase RimI-like enzyme